MTEYDSRPETSKHANRVCSLMSPVIVELDRRSREHDLSKTLPPEVACFDEFTPKLKGVRYGSDEYKGLLAQLKPALDHHYANNRHHPEFFGEAGINGMTLVDLIEMLADWRASTERTADGSLDRSLEINAERFGISGQLLQILRNTAKHFFWSDEHRGRV